MSIVRKIQMLCSENNITLTALERKLGFSKSSISRWESNSPSVDKVVTVAEYFNCTTDYLLGLSEFRNENDIKISEEKFKTISSEITKLPQGDREYIFDIFEFVIEALRELKSYENLKEYYIVIIHDIAKCISAYASMPAKFDISQNRHKYREVLPMLYNIVFQVEGKIASSLSNLFEVTQDQIEEFIPDGFDITGDEMLHIFLNENELNITDIKDNEPNNEH